MLLPKILQRWSPRLFGSARKARRAADREEWAIASTVPGRHEAVEAALNPLHLTTLSTPALMGASLLGAAALGWYYVHAYNRAHVTVPGPASHGAELADSPLPPLPPPSALPLQAANPGVSGYVIGDILNPDGAPAGDGVVVGSGRGEGVTSADPLAEKANHGPSLLLPETRRLDGSVFTRSTRLDAAMPAPADIDRKTGNSSTSATAEPSSVDRALQSEITPTVAAALLPTQRLLLPKGAFLDCTLETAIDSTLPGLTTCITAYDTFSADGTVVLLERGTKLIGEMRSQVQQGAARVFVLWTEARTPKGVVVALASPGTDALGRSGLPGTVDRHFIDRFGAAMLVSLIDGAIQSAVNRSQQPGGTIILNPTRPRTWPPRSSAARSTSRPPCAFHKASALKCWSLAIWIFAASIASMRPESPRDVDTMPTGAVRATSTQSIAGQGDGSPFPHGAGSDHSALSLTLSPLRTFLDDPELTEFCINRPGEAYIERSTGWERVPLPCASYEWCVRLAKLVANATHQKIDSQSPLLSATLPSGERAQIVLPPATTSRTVAITLRRPAEPGMDS